MKRKVAFPAIALAVAVFFFCGRAAAQDKAAPEFKDPSITLEMFEVPQYDGYWYFAASVAPTKGEAGDRGAPLSMSFLFNVENPNPYPVLLEGVQFTVALDNEFDVVP